MKSPSKAYFSDPLKRDIRRDLLAWYEQHRRNLPWRENRDPYRVWLSEIMLQQTRVAAVIGHYREFLQRFPTIKKLAAAREASVLAAWSGLGYYRRARMLHGAAKVLARKHGGKFPANAEALRELPGIGRYTAAAIASIAFGEPIAVVDGNVERVLQRLSGKQLLGERLWAAAGDLLDPKRPGDFNQAVMELGATVCTPRAPMCLTCPIIQFCATRGELNGAKKEARQRKREVHYVFDRRNGSVFLVQRPKDASLMPGMWELPELEEPSGANGRPTAPKALANPTQEQVPRHFRNEGPLLTLRHSITTTDYTVRVWPRDADGPSGTWVRVDRLATLPLTGLARKILQKTGVLVEG